MRKEDGAERGGAEDSARRPAMFDTGQVFDDDYLYFYGIFLTEERTETEVELIRTLLELQPGQRVLDLACGHGRIANVLARAGFRVVGLDESERFLELARARTPEDAEEMTYVQGDMRSLPWEGEFDAILNWFTSFGYFGDEENLACLTEAYRALREGGKLLIDQSHRDRLVRRLNGTLHSILEHPEDEGNFLLDQVSYDVATGRTHTERTVIRDGRRRKAHYSVRLFTFTELRDWLTAAGFHSVTGYGANGEPLTLDSRRMIVVATK